MDAILLPLVPGTFQLRDAQARMRDVRRSGIVSQTKGDFRLHTAAAVARGLAHGKQRLQDLPREVFDNDPAPVFRPKDLVAASHDDLLDMAQLRSFVSRSKTQWAVLAVDTESPRNEVLVLTSAERVRKAFEPPIQDCYCAVPGCVEPVPVNAQCPLHGAAGSTCDDE